MAYKLIALLILALAASACSSSPRTPIPQSNVQFGEVYIKASEISPVDRSVPVWMALRNTGTAPAEIIKAEVNSAKSVEFRNGTQPAAPPISIPAGATVDFTPQSYHVQIIGLPEAIKVGDTFGMALTFASSEQRPLTVTVRP
jgi:copper(I)-binding protein